MLNTIGHVSVCCIEHSWPRVNLLFVLNTVCNVSICCEYLIQLAMCQFVINFENIWRLLILKDFSDVPDCM